MCVCVCVCVRAHQVRGPKKKKRKKILMARKNSWHYKPETWHSYTPNSGSNMGWVPSGHTSSSVCVRLKIVLCLQNFNVYSLSLQTTICNGLFNPHLFVWIFHAKISIVMYINGLLWSIKFMDFEACQRLAFWLDYGLGHILLHLLLWVCHHISGLTGDVC